MFRERLDGSIRMAFVCLTLLGVMRAAQGSDKSSVESPVSSTWDKLIQSESESRAIPIVQNRAITRAGRFQISGPFLGMGERRDFYNNYFIGAGARFNFSEKHGWEILRATWAFPEESSLAREIREQTHFQPDAQSSRLQLGSAYVFSPIYGKYAWGDEKLIHFDIHGSLGAGVRFAKDRQVYIETGVGMSNYILSSSVSVVPEIRMRVYQEDRTTSVVVVESLFQLGLLWLL